MSDLQLTLRQLSIAMRLRSFRRERAEHAWRHSLQHQSLAEKALQVDTARYRLALLQHQLFLAHGLALNLAMQEPRQLALTAVRATVAARQRALDSALRQSQDAKDQLKSASLDAEQAIRRRQRIAEVIFRRRQAGELTEIMDAQYRQGGHRGD